MENPTAVIEITSSVIRIVIGYVIDGKPCIIYTREVPTNGTVKKGEIIDNNGLVNILASFKKISDPQAKLRISVTEATVILPSSGFEVYQTVKSTGVVSANSIIESLDIQNAISLVKKETFPNGSDVIDIIPAQFILEGNRIFGEPPLGQKSSSITLKAFIHTLPDRIVDSYRRAFEDADIVMKRIFVNSYALSHFVSRLADAPEDSIIMDMGEGTTTFTLVSKYYPYASTTVLMGGEDLIRRVKKSFNISKEDAKKLIELYGIDNDETSFKPSIIKSVNELGEEISFKTTDLNNVIAQFMSDYFKQIDVALLALLKSFPDETKHFPIIVTGGLSALNNVDVYLKNKFIESKDIIHLSPKYLGVRHPRFSNCVGALFLSTKYRGSLTDQRAKVAQVTREDEKDK